MKKLDRLRKQIEAIRSELQNLEKFRDTIQLRKFRRQLHGELSNVNDEFRKLRETQVDKEGRRKRTVEIANRNRSSKNKRVWNYVKSIQKNYRPDLSLKNIRSQLKRHRKGLETDVPDVAWRNPSP